MSKITHLDFTKGIALSTSVNRLDHMHQFIWICLSVALGTAYHSDGSSKGSLVGESVQRLKAGELSKLTGIRAQRPGSKGRQNGASCGGGSGRMCQGGHRAHRGSGGSGIHCATIGLYQRRYTKAHTKLLKLLWEVKSRVSFKREVSNLKVSSTLRVPSRNFPVSAGPKGDGLFSSDLCNIQ